MADILVRGMEMPEHCYECPCYNGESGYCQAYKSGYMYSIERPAKCPLVPLPEGHGRLGDLDVLDKFFHDRENEADAGKFYTGKAWYKTFRQFIRLMQTIVPAEGDGKNG